MARLSSEPESMMLDGMGVTICVWVRFAFDAGLEAMPLTADRRDALIEEMAAQPEYAPAVARLCCLRGSSNSSPRR